MHEASFPVERPAIYAFEAFVAHCFVGLSAVVFLSAFAFLSQYSETQPILARFALIILYVCSIWSGTLAMRSIWSRERSRTAWIILALCLLELIVPSVLCCPAIFSSHKTTSWKIEAVRWGLPLWAPIFSYIAIASIWITRKRWRSREQSGSENSHTENVRYGARWTALVSVPALLVLPILLFLYSIAPVRLHNQRTVPTDWRIVVLENTPNIITDQIARALNSFTRSRPLDANTSRTFDVMIGAGWVSETYLLERIDAGKGSHDDWNAFMGLNNRYPVTAMNLAREIWTEPFSEEHRSRFQCAAFIIVARAETAEISKLLKIPATENDSRRASLIWHCGYRKRRDVELELYGIAIDRHAPDRLHAIGSASEFMSPVVTLPLWFEFLETADARQHSVISNMGIPREFERSIFLRAFEDKRPSVLRPWLSAFYLSSNDYLENIPLLLRLLELSEHPDLSIRRGALHGTLLLLGRDTSHIDIPSLSDIEDKSDEWWIENSERLESEQERNAANKLRAELCDMLGRRL